MRSDVRLSLTFVVRDPQLMLVATRGPAQVETGDQFIVETVLRAESTLAILQPSDVEFHGIHLQGSTVFVKALPAGTVAEWVRIETEHIGDKITYPRPKSG